MVGGLCDVSCVYHVVVRVAVLAVSCLHLQQEIIQRLRVDLHQPTIIVYRYRKHKAVRYLSTRVVIVLPSQVNYIFANVHPCVCLSNMKLIRRRHTRTWHFATPLAFNAADGGVPRDEFRKILRGGQRIAKVQYGEEILRKVSTPWVGRTNVTDYRRICDSKDPNLT